MLNPVCELQDTSAAEIAYGKQIGYIFVVPFMMLLIKIVWRSIACCQGRPYFYRGPDGQSPSLNDGSVATIVFLMYLMYPTLCRQSFSLIVCHRVGDKYYLLVDLQEPCFEGRHFLWFIFCNSSNYFLRVRFPDNWALCRMVRSKTGTQRGSDRSSLDIPFLPCNSSATLGFVYQSF